MTSGEWDLNALKKLEEEEQKEFLALSQKNLYDPPSPPTTASTRLLQQQQQQQQSTANAQPAALNYAQVQQQYKLPTISECQSTLAHKRHSSGSATPSSLPSSTGMSVLSAARLKLTRALSLSAHSLSGGRVGSTSNTERATTPLHAHSLYTPPPARRCATLHHLQPVRKTFKTLHQLEQQKQAALHAANNSHTTLQKQLRHNRGLVATHKSPSLRRVAGTNKTYWKYGLPATPLTSNISSGMQNSYELDSVTSDEYGSDELTAITLACRDAGSASDADTETASCSVPVVGDSREMMRLILNAASTSIDTPTQVTLSKSKTNNNNQNNFTATSINDIWHEDWEASAAWRRSNLTQARGYHPLLKATSNSSTATTTTTTTITTTTTATTVKTYDPHETVAYEAFHAALARRKSFTNNTHNIYSAEHTSNMAALLNEQSYVMPEYNPTNRTAHKGILKTTSLDMEGRESMHFVSGTLPTVNTVGSGSNMLRSTIITNPIMQSMAMSVGMSIANTTTTTNAVMSTTTATQATTGGPLVSLMAYGNEPRSMLPLHPNIRYQQQQQLQHNQPQQLQHYQHQQQQQQQQQQQMFFCSTNEFDVNKSDNGNNHLLDIEHVMSCLGHQNGDLIDDLEQHIKNCNCSCNHMGYGNSMDYQTTGFGGLPDVTEHSNIRRTLSRQNSNSNSDSGGDIASIQKSKVNFGDGTKSPSIASSQGIGSCAGVGLAGSVGTSSGSANSVGRVANKRKTKNKNTHDNSNGNGNSEHHHFRRPHRGLCAYALTLLVSVCLLSIAALLAYQHFIAAPSRNSHAQRLRIVRRILHDVPLVDGHNNFAWNVRKYAHSSLELLHAHHEHDQKSMWTRPAWAQTDITRLRQGLIGMQVWSIYVPCEAQGMDAVQLALEQIDIIRRLTDMYADDTVLVESSKQATAVHRKGLMASLIGIEGGHAISSSLGVLRSFYSLGARYMSLTHSCDLSWAGSAASLLENGLTQFGKAVISEMNRLGMMIDLTYSSDATARDVLQVTRAPVIFSHSGARHLCNSTRNVPDEILRLVAENGGLIMISFDSEDVACGRKARLQDVIAHIKYVRAIAGVQHIGLGAGYDGIEMPPVGLEDVTKYPDLLASLLEDHNWTEEDIAMLAGKNFLRIMETVENVRDYWKSAAIQPVEQSEPQPKSQCHYMSS